MNNLLAKARKDTKGFWHECSNPLNKRVLHLHYFEMGTIYYSNLICPMCWAECLKLEGYKPVMTIASRFGHSKNKHANSQQCGSDTL